MNPVLGEIQHRVASTQHASSPLRDRWRRAETVRRSVNTIMFGEVLILVDRADAGAGRFPSCRRTVVISDTGSLRRPGRRPPPVSRRRAARTVLVLGSRESRLSFGFPVTVGYDGETERTAATFAATQVATGGHQRGEEGNTPAMTVRATSVESATYPLFLPNVGA
jgi:hypothetical protein